MRSERPGDNLRDRIENNEPLAETPVLDFWKELDPPLRGKIRQGAIERLNQTVKQRRTIDSLSSRLASNMTQPITQAIQSELNDRVKKNVKGAIKKRAENGRSGGN